MDIQKNHLRKDVTSVELLGDFLLKKNEERIKFFQDVVVGVKGNVVLDLSRVGSIDSEGIGALVGALTTVANKGYLLVPAGPLSWKIMEMLETTRLDSVFKIYDTVSEAVDSIPIAS